jgi:multicomponent Na+:H+ antiporter subunit E
MVRRVLALFVWAYGVWLLLTWTVTFEQLVFGGLLALAVSLGLASLGEVAAPWRLLNPRVLVASARLLAVSLWRVVRANIGLARRIWAPSRPLRSGMVIVPTPLQSDGGLGALGLITSLIVDNQIVDLDRDRSELQFHAVSVPADGSTQGKREAITAPTERLLEPILRRRPR